MINYLKSYRLLMFVNVIILTFFSVDFFYKIVQIDSYKHKTINLIILNPHATTQKKKAVISQADLFSFAKDSNIHFVKWEDQAWIFIGKYQNIKNWLMKIAAFNSIQIVRFSIEGSLHNNLTLQVVLCYV